MIRILEVAVRKETTTKKRPNPPCHPNLPTMCSPVFSKPFDTHTKGEHRNLKYPRVVHSFVHLLKSVQSIVNEEVAIHLQTMRIRNTSNGKIRADIPSGFVNECTSAYTPQTCSLTIEGETVCRTSRVVLVYSFR